MTGPPSRPPDHPVGGPSDGPSGQGALAVLDDVLATLTMLLSASTRVVPPPVDFALGDAIDALQAHARQTLAGYKIPRELVLVDTVERTPAGKADYSWARKIALG